MRAMRFQVRRLPSLGVCRAEDRCFLLKVTAIAEAMFPCNGRADAEKCRIILITVKRNIFFDRQRESARARTVIALQNACEQNVLVCERTCESVLNFLVHNF